MVVKLTGEMVIFRRSSEYLNMMGLQRIRLCRLAENLYIYTWRLRDTEKVIQTRDQCDRFAADKGFSCEKEAAVYQRSACSMTSDDRHHLSVLTSKFLQFCKASAGPHTVSWSAKVPSRFKSIQILDT